MLTDSIWAKIDPVLGKQQKIWKKGDYKREPASTDKFIEYLVFYNNKMSNASNAVRLLAGVGKNSYGFSWFADWNEVRVTTTRDIRNILIQAGITSDTWELAQTIKNFLQATWEIFNGLDLDAIRDQASAEELQEYLNKVVIPPTALAYLKYLLGMSRKAPYDDYTNRILSRAGNVSASLSAKEKQAHLDKLIQNKQPMIRHKKLVLLGKRICLSSAPKCNLCPLASDCDYYSKQYVKL